MRYTNGGTTYGKLTAGWCRTTASSAFESSSSRSQGLGDLDPLPVSQQYGGLILRPWTTPALLTSQLVIATTEIGSPAAGGTGRS
jgi:hypothetical protein